FDRTFLSQLIECGKRCGICCFFGENTLTKAGAIAENQKLIFFRAAKVKGPAFEFNRLSHIIFKLFNVISQKSLHPLLGRATHLVVSRSILPFLSDKNQELVRRKSSE